MVNRVLVVDDDPLTLDLAVRLLSTRGFEVTTTTDPAHALRLTRELTPAVVLTDLIMPGIDGLELVTKIIGLGKATQVVVMTGAVEAINVLDAYQVGAADYVQKPFSDVDELVTTLERAVNRYRRWRKMVMNVSKIRVGSREESQLDLSDLYDPRELVERRLAFLKRLLQSRASDEPPMVQARLVSHQLRGTGGNLGLTELAEAGRRLESTMSKGDGAADWLLNRVYDAIAEYCQRFESELKAVP